MSRPLVTPSETVDASTNKENKALRRRQRKRVLVNVGAGAGQTIFHLHWHVLGGRVTGLPA